MQPPAALLPGDPAGLHEVAGRFEAWSQVCGSTAGALERFSPSWTGAARAAWAASRSMTSTDWTAASRSLTRAAAALPVTARHEGDGGASDGPGWLTVGLGPLWAQRDSMASTVAGLARLGATPEKTDLGVGLARGIVDVPISTLHGELKTAVDDELDLAERRLGADPTSLSHLAGAAIGPMLVPGGGPEAEAEAVAARSEARVAQALADQAGAAAASQASRSAPAILAANYA